MKLVVRRLNSKLREALASVLPVTAIVLALSLIFVPLPSGTLLAFLVGAVLLVLGMGLFTLGAELSMSPMGEYAGARITKTKNLKLILSISLLLGIVVTIAEPDLTVLATQIPSIPNWVLIGSVAVGVGVFLVVAVVRMIFQINLNWLLIGFYAIIFLLSVPAPSQFVPLAFDSGGVTTGPMTVPFIMAFGAGVASIRSDAKADQDGFGLVALCSIGPILAVMLLTMLYNPGEGAFETVQISAAEDSLALRNLFMVNIPHYMAEVALALAPILVFFLVMQIVMLKLPKNEISHICVGTLYTYIGLTLFLTGANVGFMPVGSLLGSALAGLPVKWLIVPIAMLIGYYIVAAEPAVHVLTKQVSEVTDGAISPRALRTSLSAGVMASCGLAMIRVLTGVSIYWILVPGYMLAIALSFFVPPIFTAIAFDSGGVASGPMTATFLLPFAMGACITLGGNVMTDAFGVVAMVAMTPLITIQILGLIFRIRQKKTKGAEPEALQADETIIELGEE